MRKYKIEYDIQDGGITEKPILPTKSIEKIAHTKSRRRNSRYGCR